jgi:hypothetical protein
VSSIGAAVPAALFRLRAKRSTANLDAHFTLLSTQKWLAPAGLFGTNAPTLLNILSRLAMLNAILLRAGALSMLIASLAIGPMHAAAQTTNQTKAAKSTESAKKLQSLPFQGKIDKVDKTAMTITVGSRVFQVASETKIFKADKKTPAVFADAIVGDHITGSYTKADDGKLTAKSLYLGTTSDTKAATPTPVPPASGKTK